MSAEFKTIHVRGFYRHVPYYAERQIAAGETHTEDIMNDPIQGLHVRAKSAFIEVYDTEAAGVYANVIIFDGTNESMPIPLAAGDAINYLPDDGILFEWVRFEAVGGWCSYRIHATPGIHEEEETGRR